MSSNDYNRPRRPNTDTLSYLRSLPLDERIAHEEISSYVDQKQSKTDEEGTQTEEVDYPQILSAAIAAIDEVQNEIASLAGDEFGSQCIESLARIAAPYSSLAARKLLFGISGYMEHLSVHRYGSHVVQTILQLSLKDMDSNRLQSGETYKSLLELDDEQDEASNEEALPDMKALVLGIAEELLPSTTELAEHICGSHVIRTLMCHLSGIEEIVPAHLASTEGLLTLGGSRRGKTKAKKKKKKKIASEGGDGMANNASSVQLQAANDARINSQDSDVQRCFASFLYELSGVDLRNDAKDDAQSEDATPPGDLQQLACHPSAGPLLILLLRILTHRELSPSSSSDNRKRDSSSISEEEANNKSIADFRLGIQEPEAKFGVGSTAEQFAKRLLCWDDKAQESGKDQPYAGNVIYGLSGEVRGSHLLEIILQSSNDEFFEAVCNTGGLLEGSSITEYVEHDVSNYVIQILLNSIRSRSQAEIMIKCLEKSISSGYLLDAKNKRRGVFWRVVQMSAKFRVGQETVLKRMKQGFSELSKSDDVEGASKNKKSKEDTLLDFEDCVTELINLKLPEKDGGRISIDVAGARAIYQLLRFVPRLCGEILTGIIDKYDTNQLESIANDGLGSRCIIDGILDGPINQKPFSSAVKKLLEKFKGRWVSLAVERVGHHSVKKIFLALNSIEEKAILAEELAMGINRLGGNAIGRGIILDCAVKDFMEGDMVFNEAVKKLMDKNSFLKDIVGENDGEKKRKRKRKKKDKTAEA